MFKAIIDFFKQDSLMLQAYQKSYQMLDVTRDMFELARKSLRENRDNKLSTKVYNQDIEVNKFEQEVRKQVLIHLSVDGISDLSSGLILVSIIIDIERIGDYTKNIIELAQNHPSVLHGGLYEEDLKKVENTVYEFFKIVQQAIETGDETLAGEGLKKNKWVNKLCDQHVIDYITERDKSNSIGSTVTLALYFRYLKRINAHLRNIASSVVNPFDQLGFAHKPSDHKK